MELEPTQHSQRSVKIERALDLPTFVVIEKNQSGGGFVEEESTFSLHL